ncbi:MAG: DsbA family protein [Gammaproteobacteria bacterium]|nr:DsbA family protein [Gammaproteobacteria bacterium]
MNLLPTLRSQPLRSALMRRAAIFFALVFWFAPQVLAAEINEKELRELVREEIRALLNEPGAFDQAISRGIENYILEQRAAAQREQDEQQRARLENMREVDASRDHILGDPNAPVTLVEYSDFECPFCKRFHPTVARLMENNPGKIRWVYRHFPLSFHNPGAQQQAEASECVAEQSGNDAFWKFVDAIYERTTAGGNGFPLHGLRPLAEEVGADGDAFEKCLRSGRMAQRVHEDIEDAKDMGVTGTPSGALVHRNGAREFIAGALPLEELQKLLDKVSP